VILAIGGSYQASDAVHLLPMLEPIHPNTGQHLDMLIAVAAGCEAGADSFNTAYLVACEEKTLIPTNSTQAGSSPDTRQAQTGAEPPEITPHHKPPEPQAGLGG
jgi:hypothetical protein